MPAALRRRAAGLRSRLLLIFVDAGAYLACETGDQRDALGRIDLEAGDAASVRRTLAAASRRGRNLAAGVIAYLPAERALRTTVTLPLAAERNLDEVVGFEFERLMPFKRDDVYSAYRVLNRDRTARNLEIELTAIPRAEADDILRAARRVGLNITGLEIAGTKPSYVPSPILLDSGDRKVVRSRTRMAIAGLGALAVALAVVTIVVPIFQARSTLETLTAQVAEARRKADTSLDVQKQIDAEIQGQKFLIDRKRQIPTVTELLDVLTRLAPDDTWLTALQITGKEVHLVGATASATALLGFIDQSSSLRNAAFRSSITQDSKTNRERFDIAAQIVPKEGP